MPTYRLSLEYSGTKYRGWQAQKNADAVANHVEKAARQVFHTVHDLYGSGRTDAGVHALGQVAHLKTSKPKNIRANLKLALNDLLPPDIAVLDIFEVAEDFHARFMAKERVYLYQILRRRAAFGPDMAWWVKDRLDHKKMKEAAKRLVGKRDFASFCDVDPDNEKSTIMDLRSVEFGEEGAMLLLRFRADHFLWKQVRRMTGFLVEVGRGHYPPDKADAFFAAPSRELAPYTAPPAGLYLEAVCYPGERYESPLKGVIALGR